MPTFHKTTSIDTTPEKLFAWHARKGAFERLSPPWESLRVVKPTDGIKDGAVLVFEVGPGPFKLTWEAHHDSYIEGEQFRDVQKRGPFSQWEHTHRFLPDPNAEDGAILDDAITYRLPLHPVSQWFAGWFARRMIEQMFTFRHERTMHDIKRHEQFADRERQRVAITGASGLIGTALSSFLTTGGHTVSPVSRKKREGGIQWSPREQKLEAKQLEGIDAVVHLAGESVNQRWTGGAKERILRSRLEGTRLLSETLAGLERKPRVLISGSAIGFYGDRGDELLTEEAEVGDGFLADVCKQWEEATKAASDVGIRVVHLRTSLVLDPSGGALGQMLPLFKMGMGGNLGSGKQYMSWISIDDMVAAILHILFTDSIEGPVNLAAPNPVRNKEFTRTLGAVLSRPTIIPVPKFGLKLVMGSQSANEMLLASQRVVPKALEEHGFEFAYPTLEGALSHLLGKK